jgi:hypothetical protein
MKEVTLPTYANHRRFIPFKIKDTNHKYPISRWLIHSLISTTVNEHEIRARGTFHVFKGTGSPDVKNISIPLVTQSLLNCTNFKTIGKAIVSEYKGVILDLKSQNKFT